MAIAFGAALGALTVVPSAQACSLMIFPYFEPPPGMPQLEVGQWQQSKIDTWYRDQQVEQQVRLWREADSIVLVRVTAFNRPDDNLSADEWRKLRAADPTIFGATLEPVRWLKGQGQSTSFRVALRGGGDCSVPTDWQHASTKPGDVFIAYFKAGPLSNETLLDGLAPGSIVEPNVKALLSLPQ
ncbi:MAG TPA: hypothetical protein PLH23_07815 [Hyphomonadaceae bacterium]|nr:hypothetical protein [Hyphomonadaceae bacterium]